MMIKHHMDIHGLRVVGFNAALNDEYKAYKDMRFRSVQLQDSDGNLYKLIGMRDGTIKITRVMELGTTVEIYNPRYNERKIASPATKKTSKRKIK